MVNKEIVLGHIVFAEGNKVNQAKADLTLKLPKPSTITEVLQFIGACWFLQKIYHC